jgi:class 3 adenylate cyclase/alpha-beta hydrolase superfamily lysophospholipase
VKPETRYARTADGVHIAYQVIGDGPIDLVFVMGWTSNVEAMWDEPSLARFLSRLASFSRLIIFDKRGVGLSDRVSETELPTLETRMDDVRAVMDAAASERALVFGVSEGGPLSLLFAATYPERILGLVVYGTAARFAWAPDFPWGTTEEYWRNYMDQMDRAWGTREFAEWVVKTWGAPTRVGDEALIEWLTGYTRRAASPGAAMALSRMNRQIDVRPVLPAIHTRTLVLARTEDPDFAIEATRQLAEAIPGAKLVEHPGSDHFFWVGDQDSLLDEVERFAKELRDEEAELDRVLATVLFTDIVASTERAAEMGDRRWRELLDSHHSRIRALLGRFRGREVDTAGDGFLATFDGPIRAVRCALAATEAVGDLGLQIRAGLHTGEVELDGDGVRGIAVHIGARVAGMAEPSEVLVSSTVKDLVAGSALEFEDRGQHSLKGVPGDWRLYRVVA